MSKVKIERIVRQINESTEPLAVYYSRYEFQFKCADESKLIGVFWKGTTAEDLRWNADIGGTMKRRSLKKIATKLSILIESAKDPRVVEVLETAIKNIKYLA